MIVTWKHSENKNVISEELLDEKIENTFSQAKLYFDEGKKVHEWEKYELAERNFNNLVTNPRLLALSTDRHRVVLFETHYHLAEILLIKDLQIEAMKHYLEAVKIREDHKDSWFKMGEIFMAKDNQGYSEGKQKALQWYLKALQVNKCEDNTVIIKRLWDIYFLEGEMQKCLQMIDIFLERNKLNAEYTLLKSYIFSLNLQTKDEAEFLFTKARKMSSNSEYSFENVPVIQKFFKSFKPMQGKFNSETQKYEKIIETPVYDQNVVISIQKLNVRGLDKFIQLLCKAVWPKPDEDTNIESVMRESKLPSEISVSKFIHIQAYLSKF